MKVLDKKKHVDVGVAHDSRLRLSNAHDRVLSRQEYRSILPAETVTSC